MAGLIYGISAWILIGRAGAASPNALTDANLESITAVVIGGTSLFGGRGAVLGTLLGALIVGVFRSGLPWPGWTTSTACWPSASWSSWPSRSTSGSGR